MKHLRHAQIAEKVKTKLEVYIGRNFNFFVLAICLSCLIKVTDEQTWNRFGELIFFDFSQYVFISLVAEYNKVKKTSNDVLTRELRKEEHFKFAS